MAFRVRIVSGAFKKRAPGLKTGVENGMFRSEIGSGFEDPGGTPPPRIPRSTPPPPPGFLCTCSVFFRASSSPAPVQNAFYSIHWAHDIAGFDSPTN